MYSRSLLVIQNFEVLKASFLSCICFLWDLLLLFASHKCLVIGSYLKSEAIKITDSESFVHMGELYVKGSGVAGSEYYPGDLNRPEYLWRVVFSGTV